MLRWLLQDAGASPWVDQEIKWFLKHRGPDAIHLAVTEGVVTAIKEKDAGLILSTRTSGIYRYGSATYLIDVATLTTTQLKAVELQWKKFDPTPFT